MAETARGTVVVAGTSFPSLEIERSVLEPLGFRVVDAGGLPEEEVLAACRSAAAVMTDYFRCDPERIAGFERCRVICQYGVGLDQIDVEAATRARILVTHTPEYCVDELADHAMALVLAVARRIVRYDRSVREGAWDYNVGTPIRLAGSTLGLVGLGRVGQAVAKRAAGFGLRVIACDAYVPEETFEGLGVERVELEELLLESDIVSVHVPLSDETRHLLGGSELRLLKPGAIVVNTSRGGVVDQAALLEALASGRLGGAGLDVLEEEPPPAGEPLLAREDVVLTPHAGFLSIDSLRRVQQEAAEEVARALTGSRPRYCVNFDAVNAETTLSVREG